jgi:D-alanyl-D-alanine carboxypeptidase
LEIDENPTLIELALAEFYKQMNLEAMCLNLKNSDFCSAHGMHHDFNYSTAHDMAAISQSCMKSHVFR